MARRRENAGGRTAQRPQGWLGGLASGRPQRGQIGSAIQRTAAMHRSQKAKSAGFPQPAQVHGKTWSSTRWAIARSPRGMLCFTRSKKSDRATSMLREGIAARERAQPNLEVERADAKVRDRRAGRGGIDVLLYLRVRVLARLGIRKHQRGRLGIRRKHSKAGQSSASLGVARKVVPILRAPALTGRSQRTLACHVFV
jgi:hypothetical protein